MPLKSGMITPRERVFIEHYAGTHDHAYAATKAGYAHPARRGHEMLQKEVIMDAVNDRLRTKFEKLVDRVPDLFAAAMDDTRAKWADRLKAAQLIQASHHAYNPVGGADDHHPENQSSEQIRRDLEVAERRYQALLLLVADRAKQVDAIEVETIDEPSPEPDIMG